MILSARFVLLPGKLDTPGSASHEPSEGVEESNQQIAAFRDYKTLRPVNVVVKCDLSFAEISPTGTGSREGRSGEYLLK